jgi:hypothetical protein
MTLLQRNFARILAQDPDGALNSMRHNGKITLNADDLFYLCPQYAECVNDRPLIGPELYPVAARFIDECYRTLLSEPRPRNKTVFFTAGGSATGKSTILRKAGRRTGIDFIVDTTFSDTTRALLQVDRALKAGRKVEIYYVHREFQDCVRSMIERALNPHSGRLVPVDDMARTHFGAQRAILAALQKYQHDPRVLIQINKNVGRERLSSLGLREFSELLYDSIDELQRLGQSTLDGLYETTRRARSGPGKNHHARRKSFSIPIAIYKAARSKAQTARQTSGQDHTRRHKSNSKKSARKAGSARTANSC